MELKKMVVTGDPAFLYRYQFLFKALSPHFENLECLPCGDVYESEFQKKLASFVYRGLYKFSLSTADKLFHKNERAYITKSRNAERKIRQLSDPPDVVLQVFGLFSPFWDQFDIPYGMYLDYTMTLAVKNWSPWSPFSNARERDAWIECERKAYQHAYHLFPMSSLVKASLVEDYEVKSEKVTVVGSAGNFQEPYEGQKQFGTQLILFNGSDFERKGGALVLAAFKTIKQALPQAKLVIIGKKINISEEGVDNPGRIASRSELHNLFLKTDLVIAPSYCEPFQEFLLEAINYGTPCIVSDVDGMTEIVDHQVNGIVIHQPTPDSIADNAINLLRDPSRLASMSQAGRDKIKTKLNWDKIAQDIVQAFSA